MADGGGAVDAAAGALPQAFLSLPLLVVSPHMDDAALSCAAVLARGAPVDVLTVCAGGPRPPRQGAWDRICGFADSEEGIRIRLAEERAAFAGSGHRLRTLGVLESQHLDAPRAEGDAAVVGDAILRWRGLAGEEAVVLLPACAGRSYAGLEGVLGQPRGQRRASIKRWAGPLGRRALAAANRRIVLRGDPVMHGDHRFVRDAGLHALRDAPGVHLVLYEELPYLWGAPADAEVARVVSARGLRAEPVSVAVDRPAKAARVARYRSQVPHLFQPLGPLDAPAGLPPAERYWRLVVPG